MSDRLPLTRYGRSWVLAIAFTATVGYLTARGLGAAAGVAVAAFTLGCFTFVAYAEDIAHYRRTKP